MDYLLTQINGGAFRELSKIDKHGMINMADPENYKRLALGSYKLIQRVLTPKEVYAIKRTLTHAGTIFVKVVAFVKHDLLEISSSSFFFDVE